MQFNIHSRLLATGLLAASALFVGCESGSHHHYRGSEDTVVIERPASYYDRDHRAHKWGDEWHGDRAYWDRHGQYHSWDDEHGRSSGYYDYLGVWHRT